MKEELGVAACTIEYPQLFALLDCTGRVALTTPCLWVEVRRDGSLVEREGGSESAERTENTTVVKNT